MVSVTVVAPCFNEQESLAEFHRRASAACQAATGEGYEIILVDDGSSDHTWRIIESLAAADHHVKGVRLMRNHGHQLAATAGLATANGERILLIDADLQDPPEALSEMMKKLDAGADVVYGKRISRAGEGRIKLATAAIFYRVLSRLADIPIPEDTGDFRLMTRRVVDILLAMPERNRFIRGMVSWIGGVQVPYLYERDARYAGSTKYPFTKMVRFAADALTSFSTVPLRLASWLGLFIGSLAILLLLYTLWQWVNGHVVTGWSSIMISLSIFSGFQLLVLGIIGEYLGRLVQEAKGRPLCLIDTVLSNGSRYSIPLDFPNLPGPSRRHLMAQLGRLDDRAPLASAPSMTSQ